jgi:polyferredoxin
MPAHAKLAKVGKPRGLIDYCSLADEKLERPGFPSLPAWRRAIRPRTILYSSLWAAYGIVMIVALFLSDSNEKTVRHDRNPVYVTLSDGSVRNAYEVGIQNRKPDPNPFGRSEWPGDEQPYLRLTVQGEDAAAIQVAPDRSREVRVYLTAPAGAVGRAEVRLWVEDLVTRERNAYHTYFHGPEQ